MFWGYARFAIGLIEFQSSTIARFHSKKSKKSKSILCQTRTESRRGKTKISYGVARKTVVWYIRIGIKKLFAEQPASKNRYAT